jgi:chromosomal replication initiator protein
MEGGNLLMIFVRDIQAAVARAFDLPVEVMREPDGLGSRLADRAHARHVAMYLSKRLTKHTSTKIGQLFGGRDHSTILHGIKAARERARKDAALRLKVIRLTVELKHGARG